MPGQVGGRRNLDLRQPLFVDIEQTALQHVGDAPQAAGDRPAHR
jgi:hypothetical protein